MPAISAGILMYRSHPAGPEVFLVHPGGPFWAKKDLGAWSIPKGEVEPGEDPLTVARRELAEETGLTAEGEFADLSEQQQPGGKVVHVWAIEASFDVSRLRSNTITLEWPPRSGRMQEFPEVDRAAWFALDVAAEKINPAQAELLARLRHALDKANG